MGVCSYFPLNFIFSQRPTFSDLVLAAQKVRHADSLVWKNGRFEKECGYEKNSERLHRNTWCAFRKAVEDAFSPQQINHLCARYHFDWKQMTSSGLPLHRRYVEYFGVGAANPYTYTIKQKLPFYSNLSIQSPKTMYKLVEDASHLRYIGNMEDPSKVHGGAVHAHENFTHDPFLMDKHRANLFRGIDRLVSKDPNIPRLHPYYSRLSMAIVSLLETQKNIKDIELLIPAPGIRDGLTEYYKVYDIISKGGLTAVALVPVSKQTSLRPLLCFRCTKQTLGQTDAIPSMLNDMEEHIGESGYKASENKLKKLMEDPNFTQNNKIKVLCYSLGGGHAGYFMNDFWQSVDEFVAFNNVGADSHIIENLAEEINELDKGDIPPSFYLYRNVSNPEGTIGDWVNKSGQKHIGWGIHHPNSRVQVVEWIIDEKDYPAPTEAVYDPTQFFLWMNLHGARPMDSEREEQVKGKFHSPWRYSYNLYQGPLACDQILDTYNRDRTIEDLRQKIAHKTLYHFVYWTYSALDFLLRVFGIEFFKRNR